MALDGNDAGRGNSDEAGESGEVTVELFWDIGSTNTYFAYHLLKPLAARYGARVVYTPMNLGYVFRHHNYVLAEEPTAKLKNRGRDLQRWAQRYNLPFRMPDVFPIKTSRVLRGALVMRQHGLEEAYLDAVFARYWEQNDAGIAEYAGLKQVARELGVDAQQFVEEAEAPALRATFVEITQDALARGVFGAPSFLIGNELYWGKDRMEFVEDHLAQLSAG